LACLLLDLATAAGRAADENQNEGNNQGGRAKKEAAPLPNDKRLLALHNDFVKKAEKLATEFEHARQNEKAVIVYEQILKLMPDYEPAQMQLDRLRQREASSNRKTFEVQANKDWQDTGVRVIAGKPIKLTATGEWTFNMSHKLGPDGMEIQKALKDFKLGSLIGIIADPEAKQPKPFYIGPSKEFVADQSGPLLVRMHDSDPSDNKGSLMLEIVGRFEAK
jgi:hypothetical protein